VRGRYDASYGLLLRGNGAGGFSAVALETSRLMLRGEVRDMKVVRGPQGARSIVVARNDSTVQVMKPLVPRQARTVSTRQRARVASP